MSPLASLRLYRPNRCGLSPRLGRALTCTFLYKYGWRTVMLRPSMLYKPAPTLKLIIDALFFYDLFFLLYWDFLVRLAQLLSHFSLTLSSHTVDGWGNGNMFDVWKTEWWASWNTLLPSRDPFRASLILSASARMLIRIAYWSCSIWHLRCAIFNVSLP